MPSFSYSPGKTSSQDLVEFTKIFQPYAEKANKYNDLRQKGFPKADPNGNGHASLYEIESYIQNTLVSAFPASSNRGEDLFRRYRKAFLYAFNAARALHDGPAGSSDAGSSSDQEEKDERGIKELGIEAADAYITFTEFRMFNACLLVYAGMLDAFYILDGSHDGYADNKINMEEFVKSYKNVTGHGFSTLSNSVLKTEKDVQQMFHAMDRDGSGRIAYREWFDYIKKAEVEKNTTVGLLITPNCIAYAVDDSDVSSGSTMTPVRAEVLGVSSYDDMRVEEKKSP